ncbi:MAG: hypothetical protein M3506_03120 [Chloroflexota bacterium]|nr:hypothetical protein [Chloroflexota bacterium]
MEQDSTTSQAVVDQLVEAALPKLRALAVWLVEAGRDSDLRRLEREVIERGHDVLMGYLGKRPKWLHTSIGHHLLERGCYYCKACHRTLAPLDTHLGIDQSGRSPRLVELIARLGAGSQSFAQAAEDLALLCPGIEVRTSQVESVAEAVGRGIEAEALAEVEAAWREPYHQRVLPSIESRYPQLIIAIDGVLVRRLDGYRAVRVAAIGGCELGKEPEAWRYVVHRCIQETWKPSGDLCGARRGGKDWRLPGRSGLWATGRSGYGD